MNQAVFLRSTFSDTLRQADPATPREWGKMDLQQMVEHMSDSFRMANGKDLQTCVTPAEHIEKMQAFLMSDKPFRPNTPNAQMPDTPLPHRNATYAAAIDEMQAEINDFFTVFEQEPARIITNPFFGDLNFAMWQQLLTKHCEHHLRQFNLLNT
jgi:hypothetical protein